MRSRFDTLQYERENRLLECTSGVGGSGYEQKDGLGGFSILTRLHDTLTAFVMSRSEMIITILGTRKKKCPFTRTLRSAALHLP